MDFEIFRFWKFWILKFLDLKIFRFWNISIWKILDLQNFGFWNFWILKFWVLKIFVIADFWWTPKSFWFILIKNIQAWLFLFHKSTELIEICSKTYFFTPTLIFRWMKKLKNKSAKKVSKMFQKCFKNVWKKPDFGVISLNFSSLDFNS